MCGTTVSFFSCCCAALWPCAIRGRCLVESWNAIIRAILKSFPARYPTKSARFLPQESQRIQEAASQAERYQAQYDAGELSAEVLAYYLDALEIRMHSRLPWNKRRINTKRLSGCRQAGVSVQYVYETGWSRLFGAEGQRMDLVNSLLLSIFFMLTVGISRCREFHTGMWSLARTTQNGRRSEGMQLLLCALLGGLAALTAFLMHIGLLGISLPGWNSVEYSVQSITALSRGLGCSFWDICFCSHCAAWRAVRWSPR